MGYFCTRIYKITNLFNIMQPPIYPPSEDSYFMSEVLKKEIYNKDAKIIEIGVGSGIQLETLRDLGIKNITGVDINNNALYLCREKGFNVKKSNLFSKISLSQKFDIIIFNPPYLPEHKFDKKPDTSGGKKGDETIIEFLKQAKNHLNENGIIFLLTSSLTPKIDFKKYGYKSKMIEKKKLFLEELYVWKLIKRE